MKNILYNGRPEDLTDRAEKEVAVYDFLDSLGVKYSRVDHDHADTISDCEMISDFLGAKIFKNLVLCNAQKNNFYLLIMPGEKPFKTKLLSSQLGCSRLSFAPPEYMERYINCTPGSASIMGLIFDTELAVKLVIDRDLMNETIVGLHPCVNTSSLAVNISDLTEKIIPATNHTPTYVEL